MTSSSRTEICSVVVLMIFPGPGPVPNTKPLFNQCLINYYILLLHYLYYHVPIPITRRRKQRQQCVRLIQGVVVPISCLHCTVKTRLWTPPGPTCLKFRGNRSLVILGNEGTARSTAVQMRQRELPGWDLALPREKSV